MTGKGVRNPFSGERRSLITSIPVFEVRSRRVSPDSLEVAVALTTSKETPTGLLGGKSDLLGPDNVVFLNVTVNFVQ